jgi:hypothetical protein
MRPYRVTKHLSRQSPKKKLASSNLKLFVAIETSNRQSFRRRNLPHLRQQAFQRLQKDLPYELKILHRTLSQTLRLHLLVTRQLRRQCHPPTAQAAALAPVHDRAE